MNRITVSLRVNGQKVSRELAPETTLLEFLRDDLNLTGVKCGCDDSNCGACTVLVDGRAIKSCCMLALQADGALVTTIEGMENAEGLHPLQRSFIDHYAIQCGFCTPAMILTSKALLDENPNPTEEEIRDGLHGNICRCTGYTKIVRAVMAVRDGEYGDYRAYCARREAAEREAGAI